MTTLWDTNGSAVVKELAAQRRTGGAVLSGVALTLVVVADESRVTEAEEAATHAAEMHPCRVLVVVRRQIEAPTPRLDAEVVIGGRLGPGEAVVMRMYGRLGLHAESVVLPAAGRRRPRRRLVARRAAGPAGHRRARRSSPTAGSPTARWPTTRSPRCAPARRTTRRATPTWPGPAAPAGGRSSPPASTRCPAAAASRCSCRAAGSRATRPTRPRSCSPAG